MIDEAYKDLLALNGYDLREKILHKDIKHEELNLQEMRFK